jgi:hypothetical protein
MDSLQNSFVSIDWQKFSVPLSAALRIRDWFFPTIRPGAEILDA